ncbi:MAG TPA: hypothetical protein VNO81_05670 [Candidatus Nitrosotenuis sp.]|jgi:hypothetical protein|nr:hypothetical protein [Candidatus Nitrosotenuis sp.]
MSAARVFLEKLLDYAGLFPPASLALDQALDHYQSYRSGPWAWMLGRLVLPAARLDEVAAALAGRAVEGWALSVVAERGPDPEAAARAALEGAAALLERHPGLRLEVLEVPLVSGQGLEAVLTGVARLAPAGLRWIFCEPAGPEETEALVQAAAEVRDGVPVGVKLRTGGGVVPEVSFLARALSLCGRAGVAVKATAGLHHPVRHRTPEGRVEHGFLNVFTAAMLAREYSLEPPDLEPILAEENLQAFTFEEQFMNYENYWLPDETIRRLRSEAAISMGSCSFLEPVEHLQAAGLLPR